MNHTLKRFLGLLVFLGVILTLPLCLVIHGVSETLALPSYVEYLMYYLVAMTAVCACMNQALS